MQVPSQNEMDQLDKEARNAAVEAFVDGQYTAEIERVHYDRGKNSGKGYTRADVLVLNGTGDVVGRGQRLLTHGHEVPGGWKTQDGIANWGPPVNKHDKVDWRSVNAVLKAAGLDGIPTGDYAEDEAIRNLEGVRFPAQVTKKSETYQGETRVVLDIRPLINGRAQ